MDSFTFKGRVVNVTWVPTGDWQKMGSVVPGLGVAFDTWGGTPGECSTAYSPDIEPSEAQEAYEAFEAS
jgi:hypothetical protein